MYSVYAINNQDCISHFMENLDLKKCICSQEQCLNSIE